MSILSANSLAGDKVVNRLGEDLGEIRDFMIDTSNGQVAYAVLECGGFAGIGSKLVAVPLQAMRLDSQNRRFIFDQPRERLKEAPGFDKDHWPDFSDRTWGATVHDFYNVPPYWS